MAFNSLKEIFRCYTKRFFFNRGVELCVEDLPLFCFRQNEIEYNLNTTNNTIKTPKGFFRICFEHCTYKEYIEILSNFNHSVPENQRPKRGYDFFINKGLRDWRLNDSRYTYQTYNVCSSACEELVARMLGIERLLTQSFFCRIKVEGLPELIGAMSSVAEGVDVRELKDNYQQVLTPNIAKDLTNLNIIDTICYEKDHRPGNYHVVLDDKGKAVSICSFDNDSPWSFSPFGGASFETYAGASILIKNGVINRPLIDENVSVKLQNLTQKEVYETLGVYLRENQLKACWKRISAIRRAISRTQFDQVGWTADILEKELSGRYGKTYFAVLWYLCEDIKKGLR